LDTEGLGSLEVSREHDASIFALALLVSSGCFFNTLGSITSQTLEDLHLASKVAGLLCKHLQFRKQLPGLVWILRDFTLELCDRNGLPISADVYLEQCLDTGDPTRAADLRMLFPSRHCLPLPRPTAEEGDLREMRNLRPEFHHGLKALRETIRQYPPKTIGNLPATGDQLCVLVEALCTALNSQAVPDLSDVWTLVSQQARKQAQLQAQQAVQGATSCLEGLRGAYAAYTTTSLDESLTSDALFALVCEWVRDSPQDSGFEQKYTETRRALDVQADTHVSQLRDWETKFQDQAGYLEASHRKVAILSHESLTLQHHLKELEDVVSPPILETPALLSAMEGLQEKHQQLKAERLEQKQALAAAAQKIRVLEESLEDLTPRLEAARTLATSLESGLQETKNDLQRTTTEVAIWRARYEETQARTEKKRKVGDDAYTERITLTSEVTFLRGRREEDLKRLQSISQDNRLLLQQVQTLQVRLAVEISKG